MCMCMYYMWRARAAQFSHEGLRCHGQRLPKLEAPHPSTPRLDPDQSGVEAVPYVMEVATLCVQAGIKQRGVEERPDDRLSWNLESRSTGGWRVRAASSHVAWASLLGGPASPPLCMSSAPLSGRRLVRACGMCAPQCCAASRLYYPSFSQRNGHRAPCAQLAGGAGLRFGVLERMGEARLLSLRGRQTSVSVWVLLVGASEQCKGDVEHCGTG